jgi:phytoene desaturase
MYLVGGGTHPGSGLPVIFESARISSQLLIEDFGLRVPWTKVAGPEGSTGPANQPVDRATPRAA